MTVPDAPLHDADGNFLDSEGNVVLTDAEDDPLLSDGQTLAFHDTIDAEAFLAAANAEEPVPGEYGVYVPGVPVVVEGWLDDAGASELATPRPSLRPPTPRSPSPASTASTCPACRWWSRAGSTTPAPPSW